MVLLPAGSIGSWMAAGYAKPRLLVTGPPFSSYPETQSVLILKSLLSTVLPTSQDWQTECAGAGHLFPVAETSDCSFTSGLLFPGKRSFSWVQRTTCFCFFCSDMCPVTRSWPVGQQGRSTLFIVPFLTSWNAKAMAGTEQSLWTTQ